MTDHGAYWSDWAVAERENETRAQHMKSCKGCTWCVGAAPAAVSAVAPTLSREAATAKWDASPLVAAAALGDIDWVKELLAEGADVNEFSSAYEYSPLIVAAQKGHVEVVRTLLMTGVCDLTKKHLEYINALDSALHGYYNFSGCDEEYTPEIRAMIIRAYVETSDRINLDTLLHIEASGAVAPDQIKAFRSGLGARNKVSYPKALPGKLNLNDPPAAKMQAVRNAADNAARRIKADREAAEARAAALAAGGSLRKKTAGGDAAAACAPRWVDATAAAADKPEVYDDDEDEYRYRKAVCVDYSSYEDACYGNSRRQRF